MTLSEQLVAENEALWRTWQPHAFTRAVAENTIDPAVFLRWVAQDYRFVSEGLRFLAVLLSKAPHGRLDTLSDTIGAWKTELALFRDHAGAAGADLAARSYLVTRAYVDFLLATAHQESFVVGWAVLYGVEKSYHDAWRWALQHSAPHNPYRHWMENWGSDAFGGFVAHLAQVLDEMDAAGLDETTRAVIHARFAETARYEWLFWEMAQHGEQFGPHRG